MVVEKVSIVVTTYNHKDYISNCLDNILNQQTNFNYEIILGDDESDDGTREICQEYAKKYPNKIRLFLRSRKDVIKIGGRATGRYNFIENLKACKGKYIALCEGDDYWTDPLKLQKQVDFLEANDDYALCFHEVAVFNQTENRLEIDNITRSVPKTTTINELAKGNFIHTPSVVLRNDFMIPKWFSKSPLGDWTFYMIIIKDKKIMKLEETMAVYRMHMEGVWSMTSQDYRNKKTLISVGLILKKIRLTGEVKAILKSRLQNSTNNKKTMLTFKKKVKNIINSILK